MKGHLQQDMALSRVSVLCDTALSGSRARGWGVSPRAGGAWWLLLWIFLSVMDRLLPKFRHADPQEMLLSPPGRNRWLGWGHTHSVRHGVVSHWFMPILEQEEGAGQPSRSTGWHVVLPGLPAAPGLPWGWWREGRVCLLPRGGGAFPRGVPGRSAACAASTAGCSVGAAEGGPSLPRPPHRAPLLPGTFTNHISHFLSLRSCLGSRLAHRDFSHAWQGGLVTSKPWLVCG